MPSHATIKKLSFLSRALFVISGKQVTAYYSGLKFRLSLNSKSPKALLIARLPSTLSSSTQWQPDALIRFSSLRKLGLWSSHSPIAVYLFFKTARLSPTLAQNIWSGVINTIQAVHPASMILANLICSSIYRQAFSRAFV